MNLHIGPRSLSTKLNDSSFLAHDEAILKLAKGMLERPSNSSWHDDELWNTHTFMFAYAPDADDLIGQSNYECILEDLSTAYARHRGAIESGTFGHWTYSHYAAIKVKVCYANGEIHPAFADAATIAISLRDEYPLYSEDHHSELEVKEWERAIGEETDWTCRDSELEEIPGLLGDDEILDDTKAELFRADVLEYLSDPERSELIGYHDVGFIPEETMRSALAYATSMIDAARPCDGDTPIAGLEA